MKILFTGAQGTGKTTILNNIKGNPMLSGYEVVSSISRYIQDKLGIDLKGGENTNEDAQKIIFNAYQNKFIAHPNILSDRSLFDVYAYTYYRHIQKEISAIELVRQYDCIKQFEEYFPNDIIYFYFPIEFAPISDGVRSIDVNFQHKIDDLICSCLEHSDISRIYEVHGSIEERTEFVLQKIGNNL